MRNTQFLSVRNWDCYQHYKQTRGKGPPPWIKVYASLLEDPEFIALPEPTRLHLVSIWLLASRCKNRIPYDAKWIAVRINATSRIDFDALVNGGFLDICDGYSMLACNASISGLASIEKRREEKTPYSPPLGDGGADAPSDVPQEGTQGFSRWWKEYPRGTRKTGRGKSLTHWRQNGLEGIADRVIACLKRFRESADWTREDGRFIPGPIVWLRRAPWETDPADLEPEEVATGNGFKRAPVTPDILTIAFGDEGEAA